ncbi:MAG: archaemetzincin family Zn-dependent metalloprotease [Deltaproteobacteria bacterium]|nr:archaemetzincin family Zn-dependent metalloprotease [Deltaproteobacteria bacterium]
MESKEGNVPPVPCITLCRIGPVDPAIIDHLSNCITFTCGLNCNVCDQIDPPLYAFDENRRQYDSKKILKHLIGRRHPSLKFLAITQLDLFVPILKYVFGLAQVQGQCAIISTCRLRPEYYGRAPDPALFLERGEKTALHELGHSLGLTHCRDRRCIMHSATTIQDTDMKRPRFCPTCRELFRWQLAQCVPEAGEPGP